MKKEKDIKRRIFALVTTFIILTTTFSSKSTFVLQKENEYNFLTEPDRPKFEQQIEDIEQIEELIEEQSYINELLMPKFENFKNAMIELFPDYYISQNLDKPLIMDITYDTGLQRLNVKAVTSGNQIHLTSTDALNSEVLEHELFHVFSPNFTDRKFGFGLEEGITQFLTEEIFDQSSFAYMNETSIAKMLALILGVENIIEPYLNNGTIHDIIATLDNIFGGDHRELVNNIDNITIKNHDFYRIINPEQEIPDNPLSIVVRQLVDYFFIVLEDRIDENNIDEIKMMLWKFELNLHLCNFAGRDLEFEDVKAYFYEKKNNFSTNHDFYSPDFKWGDFRESQTPEEWLSRKYIHLTPTMGFVKHEFIDNENLTEKFYIFITSNFRFTGDNNTLLRIEDGQSVFREVTLEELSSEDIAIFSQMMEENITSYERTSEILTVEKQIG